MNLAPKKIMLLQQTLEESKSICSVELFTVKYKLDGLKEFIAIIENYSLGDKGKRKLWLGNDI